MEEILWRLRIDELDAQLVLREIERVGLLFEIYSPHISPEGKAEAIARRAKALLEARDIMMELEVLRGCNCIAGEFS